MSPKTYVHRMTAILDKAHLIDIVFVNSFVKHIVQHSKKCDNLKKQKNLQGGV